MKSWVKLLLILGAVGALLAWILVAAEQREARMSAPAHGVVTLAELVEDEESSSLDETRISYRFDAGGKTEEGTDTLPGDRTGDYLVGNRIALCYNPANTAESGLAGGTPPKCGE